MRFRILPILLLALSAAPLQSAPVYKWTDEFGRTHFSDSPPPRGTRSERVQLPGNTGGSQAAGQPARAAVPASRPGPSRHVRQRRCNDFRSALVQLDGAQDVTENDPQWLAARDVAEGGVRRWCGETEG